MRKIFIYFIFVVFLFLQANNSEAYWIWTPESHKWINPKHDAKDTATEQFEWSMDFYNQKQYKRAIKEFRKLIKAYPKSKYAAEAQYFIGKCYFTLKSYSTAFDELEKAVEKYPGTTRMENIIECELEIADYFYVKQKKPVLGINMPKDYSVSINVYKSIVKNAPYAKNADRAQFFLAESYRNAGKYDEAMEAYNKVMERYPESPYALEAKCKIVFCKPSGSDPKEGYNKEQSEVAVKKFEELTREQGDSERIFEVREEMRELCEENAKKIYDIAAFYEKQKVYKAAMLYYEELEKKYPKSTYMVKAKINMERISKILDKQISKTKEQDVGKK